MKIDGRHLTGGPVRLSVCDESVYATCDTCKKSACVKKNKRLGDLITRLRFTGCHHGIGCVERAATKAWREEAMRSTEPSIFSLIPGLRGDSPPAVANVTDAAARIAARFDLIEKRLDKLERKIQWR